MPYGQSSWLVGVVGKDGVTLRQAGEHTVGNFDLCVGKRMAKGKKRENTDYTWFRITVWNSVAEECARLLSHKQHVIVCGEISLRKWESNGKQGVSLEVSAEHVGVLVYPFKDDQGFSAAKPQQKPQPMPMDAPGSVDDGIPF